VNLLITTSYNVLLYLVGENTYQFSMGDVLINLVTASFGWRSIWGCFFFSEASIAPYIYESEGLRSGNLGSQMSLEISRSQKRHGGMSRVPCRIVLKQPRVMWSLFKWPMQGAVSGQTWQRPQSVWGQLPEFVILRTIYQPFYHAVMFSCRLNAIICRSFREMYPDKWNHASSPIM
jgi:hypothetical protein